MNFFTIFTVYYQKNHYELSDIRTSVGAGAYQSAVLDTKEWIKIAAIQDTHLLQELLLSLDEGEAASIILAIEKQADYLIIDESEGRKSAQKFNIRITGLLGVLVHAK